MERDADHADLRITSEASITLGMRGPAAWWNQADGEGAARVRVIRVSSRVSDSANFWAKPLLG